MGQTVKEAVDSARIHHQLFPPEVAYEFGVPKQVVDDLKQLGHIMERYKVRGSVACVVTKSCYESILTISKRRSSFAS